MCVLQCFVDGVIKPEVKDLRACPEVGGTVMFPADSNPYPFGVDPYWHGTKVRHTLQECELHLAVLLPHCTCSDDALTALLHG